MKTDIKKMLIELEHYKLGDLSREQVVTLYTESELNNLWNCTNYLVWQKDPLVKALANKHRENIKKCYKFIIEDLKEKRGYYEN